MPNVKLRRSDVDLAEARERLHVLDAEIANIEERREAACEELRAAERRRETLWVDRGIGGKDVDAQIAAVAREVDVLQAEIDRLAGEHIVLGRNRRSLEGPLLEVELRDVEAEVAELATQDARYRDACIEAWITLLTSYRRFHSWAREAGPAADRRRKLQRRLGVPDTGWYPRVQILPKDARPQNEVIRGGCRDDGAYSAAIARLQQERS